MLAFAWPWLWLVLPLPWLAARLLPPAPPAPPSALRVPFFQALAPVTERPRVAAPGPWLRRLAWLVWLLLVTALARPRWIYPDHGLALYPYPLALALVLSVALAGLHWMRRQLPRHRPPGSAP